MLVEEELARVSPQNDTMLSIGVFDGVHLGHKYLISQLKKLAKRRHLLSGIITFRPHPREVLLPDIKLAYLTTFSQRARFLEDEHVDMVITLTFDQEMARLGARNFITLLQKHLRTKGLVIGYDFVLGQSREGNSIFLAELGEELGFIVRVVPPLVVNGHIVSSTTVRNALSKGDMETVHSLTGRYFNLHAPVVSGTGRGTGLGFPTANLEIEPRQALPPDGVYTTRAYIDGKPYQSVTNIGQRPTFGNNERTVEVYILDYHTDIYGRELTIDIIERLRGERKFASAEDLKIQITQDIAQSRETLTKRRKNEEE